MAGLPKRKYQLELEAKQEELDKQISKLYDEKRVVDELLEELNRQRLADSLDSVVWEFSANREDSPRLCLELSRTTYKEKAHEIKELLSHFKWSHETIYYMDGKVTVYNDDGELTIGGELEDLKSFWEENGMTVNLDGLRKRREYMNMSLQTIDALLNRLEV